MIYILKIVCAIRKMTIEELKDFLLENCYMKIEFPEENSYYEKWEEQDILLLANKL